MKFKKTLAALIVSTSLLSISTSAFAEVGFGDTKETAVAIGPGWEYSNYLDGRNDLDFTVYQNDTSSAVSFAAYLQSPSGYDYNFTIFITRANGTLDVVTPTNAGPGGKEIVGLTASPGDKFEFAVFGQNGTSTNAYYTFGLDDFN